MTATRSPGQRAGLTASRIVEGARELLAEGGVDALTMRALAERLGVAPNALYSHIQDKAALIDAVLDDVLGDLDSGEADAGGPVAGLEKIMASTFDLLLDHAELVPLYLARQGARGPNAHRLGRIMLELLDEAGVRGGQAGAAQRVLIVYTIGFAAFGVRAPFEPEGPVPGTEVAEAFRQGLRWLLAGIAGASA